MTRYSLHYGQAREAEFPLRYSETSGDVKELAKPPVLEFPRMQQENPRHQERFHEVSVVVPVYQGEHTLKALVAEIANLTTPQTTPNGSNFRVAELLLVHDGAVDRSADVMKDLTSTYPFVHCVWLSRNYGQHP